LAEHMVCNHGVRGSTPLTSTKSIAIADVTVGGFAVSVIEAFKVERSI
jgi:hypothetical protein